MVIEKLLKFAKGLFRGETILTSTYPQEIETLSKRGWDWIRWNTSVKEFENTKEIDLEFLDGSRVYVGILKVNRVLDDETTKNWITDEFPFVWDFRETDIYWTIIKECGKKDVLGLLFVIVPEY